MKDDIIEIVVDKIQQLPFEKEFTIRELAENCDEKELLDIAVKVLDRVVELGSNIKSKYEGQYVGLLYNIPFYKIPSDDAETEYEQDQKYDFILKLYSGVVTIKENGTGIIDIAIYSDDFIKAKKYSIKIDGKEYSIKNQNLFNKIKQFVTDNLDILISWAKKQTNYYLDSNVYEGGKARNIKVKYGQLILNVNGQNREFGSLCDEFINKIVNIIINESKKTAEDIMNEFLDATEEYKLSNEDIEFEKYCKLYEEKFGKRAYIAEPSGTKQQTIDAIKKCLEENKDILDELLFR